MIIAIDGFSGTGKGTLAVDLAKELGYKYIDSGAMYRAVTLFAIEEKILNNENELLKRLDDIFIDFDINNETILNGNNVEKKIRGMEVSNNVSEISKIKEVRERLINLQRNIGKKGDIVMDGRDIGSIVFPNAEIKIFMVCKPEIRAQRRQKDIKGATFEQILENILTRDKIDTNRNISPLKKMPDSVEIDTSYLEREDQLNIALDIIKNYEKNKN